MKRIALFTLLLSFIILWSCGGDDDDMDDSTDVSLSSVADGEGRIVTTGNAEATIDGVMTFTSIGISDNDDDSFNFATYALVSDPNGAFITIYWPASEGESIPNGSYDIGFLDVSIDGNNTPSGRFIQLSVVVDEISYSTFIGTSGTAEVSNATSDNSLDITFTATNLEEFFDELTINASGAVKYRN